MNRNERNSLSLLVARQLSEGTRGRLLLLLVVPLLLWNAYPFLNNSLVILGQNTAQQEEKPQEQVPSDDVPPASVLSLHSRVASSPCALQLSKRCTVQQAPMFLTFIINLGIRWSDLEMARSLRYMYSSLVRAHGCSPVLHVHTRYTPAEARAYFLGNATTTLGTSMHDNIIFSTYDEDALDNAYQREGQWLALSRSKLDIYERLLMGAARPPVWIDIDTFVMSAAAINVTDHSWVIGYQFGNNRENTEMFCQGDLWMLNEEALLELRAVEEEFLVQLEQNTTTELPSWDLQSYFGILLSQNRGGLQLIQDLRPDYVYGFACAGFGFPFPDKLAGITMWEDSSSREGLLCYNHLHQPSLVGAISYHTWSYKETFLNTTEDPTFLFIEDPSARRWMNDFFYDSENCALPGVV